MTMNDAPPVSREEPARRGEERPVQGSELRSEGLAAQDAYLMAKDQDFQVLGTLVRAPAYEQARECLHDEGQEEEHRSMVEGNRWLKHGPEFPTPTSSLRSFRLRYRVEQRFVEGGTGKVGRFDVRFDFSPSTPGSARNSTRPDRSSRPRRPTGRRWHGRDLPFRVAQERRDLRRARPVAGRFGHGPPSRAI